MAKFVSGYSISTMENKMDPEMGPLVVFISDKKSPLNSAWEFCQTQAEADARVDYWMNYIKTKIAESEGK